MVDGLHTLGRGAKGVQDPNVAFDELRIHALEVSDRPRRQVVEDRDLVPSLEQGAGQVRADESRSPGDQRLHAVLPFHSHNPAAVVAATSPTVMAIAGPKDTVPTRSPNPAATAPAAQNTKVERVLPILAATLS